MTMEPPVDLNSIAIAAGASQQNTKCRHQTGQAEGGSAGGRCHPGAGGAGPGKGLARRGGKAGENGEWTSTRAQATIVKVRSRSGDRVQYTGSGHMKAPGSREQRGGHSGANKFHPGAKQCLTPAAARVDPTQAGKIVIMIQGRFSRRTPPMAEVRDSATFQSNSGPPKKQISPQRREAAISAVLVVRSSTLRVRCGYQTRVPLQLRVKRREG